MFFFIFTYLTEQICYRQRWPEDQRTYKRWVFFNIYLGIMVGKVVAYPLINKLPACPIAPIKLLA